METYATLMIILLCWAILLVADLVVSGLLRLVAKVPEGIQVGAACAACATCGDCLRNIGGEEQV